MRRPPTILFKSIYRPLATMASPASLRDRHARSSRALREVSLVRRAIRGARAHTNGVVGRSSTIDALQQGAVSELLITRRFIEIEPVHAAKAVEFAADRHVPTTMISGVAALELDLVTGGIGALLSRAPAPSHTGNALR